MRVIKFRAWVHGEMASHEEVLKNYAFDNLAKDGLLMQFTGLLDKNGKEIYEGDVVKGKTTLPMEIVHQGHQYGVGYIAAEGPQAEPITSEFLAYMRSENWEVIGNIYENEELLTN